MSVSRKVCPVPFDQQPLNEFYSLKNSCFFSFFGFKFSTYIHKVVTICLISIFLFAPIFLFAGKFSWPIFLWNQFVCMIIVLILVLVRLYLGWSYVLDRLISATVFYEESGWYDGQIWIKTPEILTKDRLMGTYYVVPLLRRIKYTLAILTALAVGQILLYRLIC